MSINLRNIFARMQPTSQDIQTLHGVVMAIAEGRKGPARGGVLDGREAGQLRALLAEHGHGRVPNERGPVRGLSRLLRRNPTDAERTLWDALVKDRRFAGQGFKRQVPVGPHITDLVSFPLRTVIDLVPGDESEAAAKARAEKNAWLAERGYRLMPVRLAEIEADVAKVLDELAAGLCRRVGNRERVSGRGAARCNMSSRRARRVLRVGTADGKVHGEFRCLAHPPTFQRLELRRRTGAQEARGRCRPRGSGSRAWRRTRRAPHWRSRGPAPCCACAPPHHAVELALDQGGMRLDLGAVGERDRQVGRADEQRVDALGRRDGVEVVDRGARLDHRERDGERVRLVQVGLHVAHAGERHGALRAPAALADRRVFRDRRRTPARPRPVLIIGAITPSAPMSSTRLATEKPPTGMRTIGAAPAARMAAMPVTVPAVSHSPCCWSMVTAGKPSRPSVSATIG